MNLKRFFKSDPTTKTYLTAECTYKVKNKVKKLKNILEDEAKDMIDKSRRESVYTPLEDNMTVESLTEKNINPSKTGKHKHRTTSVSVKSKSDDILEEPHIDSVDSETQTQKNKKKKKKKGSKLDEEEPKRIDLNDDIADDNLNTSVSHPLISEPECSRHLRTIYIGNLPVTFKKKKLLKVLRQYGNVEKMWTRGAKPLSALPKKIALIKGKLPENHPPLMVHAVFKTDSEAHNALKLNKELYDGNRLRVTMSQEKVFDSRKGVFVGNLPFEISDDALFDLFQQCGEIVNVRVVRDDKTGAGKGFGYVNFKSIDSVELALNLNEEKLVGREIRVQRLFSPGKKKKMDKKKEKLLLKENSSKKSSFSLKKNKSAGDSGKRLKKKNKLSVTDIKKKIMAKKLSLKSKKSAN